MLVIAKTRIVLDKMYLVGEEIELTDKQYKTLKQFVTVVEKPEEKDQEVEVIDLPLPKEVKAKPSTKKVTKKD